MSKTFEQGKNEIAKLCRYFEMNRQSFLAPGVKEAHVRQTLIDPLFEALGWDVRNSALIAPQYREVMFEDSLEIEGRQKAPDYAFRVGQTLKFFAEAKKCGVNINSDSGPAYQLRRYGWSAKTPCSILTDFEELAIYDCASRPRPGDQASHARTLYLRYDEYADRLHEIWDIFSREAVWSGAFDQYAANKRKRGTSEVDAEFLKEIEGWRVALARNFALRNPSLSADDLNAAVQLTIDRVIFLRMAEDRRLEPEEQLLKLCEREGIYTRFVGTLCHKADEKYNSGMFHFRNEAGVSEGPDQITPKLHLDDKVLRPILQSLYFAHGSPYEFTVLPVEILGTVYERFIGKVIRLTAGHQAKVEDKPEVRKAGGVYYTPQYIVDYIVARTVGVEIEGKSPAQIARQPLRVLDMACGSGSFLLGAYRFLLDYCLKWYTGNNPEAHKKALFRDGKGEWRLTIGEKKRILIAHIFGVDVDRQAVEVSKLSLLLTVLEGENDQTFARQMALFHERALPNLADNIKCGNSLIDHDYFADRLLPDTEEVKRINPFDWRHEFPEAMKSGGFDCVVGNPPYIFTRDLMTKPERGYYATHFAASWEKQNTFMLFMEHAERMTKRTGCFSFIVPNSWLSVESARLLRDLMRPKLASVIDLNYEVFERVAMEPCVFVCNGGKSDAVRVARVNSAAEFAAPTWHSIAQGEWDASGRISFSGAEGLDAILRRVALNATTVGDVFDVRTGLQAYEKGKGVPKQTAADVKNHVFDRDHGDSDDTYRYLEGKDVRRYETAWSGMWMRYGRWLSQPRTIDVFARPRVLIREITSPPPCCLNATFEEDCFLSNKSVLTVLDQHDDVAKLKMLVGVLNSRLISAYYKGKAVKGARRVFPKIVIKNLREFPYPKDAPKAHVDSLIALVDSTLVLRRQLSAARSEATRTILRRQLDDADRRTDACVYELFGLEDADIELVESHEW